MVTAGNHLFDILVSPAMLGWIPSPRSEEVKPVNWSTIQMGDSVVFRDLAQSGMAALMALTAASRFGKGMIWAT
jgi:hypothetical protein